MRTFKRLLGFLRPYRRSLIVSLVLAWAAMGMTVAIPWLVGETVDAIQRGNRPDILPLAAAILGAGLLRLGLTATRRLVAGRVSLGVEFDLRNRIYSHLQLLELGFFDNQQTGQLMSRATVDLQSIRFFLGYGLIFITQNALTILLASTVMIVIKPWLAALALLPVPFVVWAATRYNRRNRPALQEVQQRMAEVSADAEEGVAGIRIVKAFAREPRIASAPGAPPLPDGKGKVEIEGASLNYDGGEAALEDIDLTVEAGRTVALVGPTGSGKTSLVALLARLYDPSRGAGLVEGV